MTRELGRLETQLIAYCQSRGSTKFTAGEAVRTLRWTPEQERKVLSRLARKGIALRVRRGLYLFPDKLPIGDRWNPGEMYVLSALIAERGGRYQITGPNAFQRYGWTEQIPNRIYAYNNRLSGDREIGSVALSLIKVSDIRLGDTETVRTPEGQAIVYSAKPRALVDAVYDWARFDTLPRAYRWIENEVDTDDTFASKLVQSTVQFGNQGTIRRIGAVLERVEVQEALLRKLERELRRSTALIPLVPTRPKRGSAPRGENTNRRWGVVNNDE